MAQLFWPFDPSIINYGYGNAPGYGGFHNGIDFPVPQGTELRATVSGIVRNNDAGQTDGAGVDITTPDGWKVRMWHVSAFLVPNGSQVEAGQVIALSGGARGTWGAGNATGAHLHWGVMVGGQWVDPASLNPQTFGQPPAPQQEEIEMYSKVNFSNGAQYLWNMATGELRHIDSAPDNQRISETMRVYGFVDETDFRNFANKYPFKFTAQVDTASIAAAIKDSLQINIDGLAQAIADKIDCNGGSDVTTKAEILEAIEANYPGDK